MPVFPSPGFTRGSPLACVSSFSFPVEGNWKISRFLCPSSQNFTLKYDTVAQSAFIVCVQSTNGSYQCYHSSPPLQESQGDTE